MKLDHISTDDARKALEVADRVNQALKDAGIPHRGAEIVDGPDFLTVRFSFVVQATPRPKPDFFMYGEEGIL